MRFLPVNKIFLLVVGLLMGISTTMVWAQDTIACNSRIAQGIDLMMKGKHPQAIENLMFAYEMAASKNWKKQEFKAINNVGLTYYKMMDYGKALTFFLQAYELALEQKNPNNEMTVLNNIAIVYIKEGKREQAESYFLKSFEIAQKQENNKKIGYYAVNLANINMEINRYDIAEKYINIAFPKIQNEPYALASAKIIQNAILIEKNKLEEAIKNLNLLLQEIEKEQYIEEKIETMLLLSHAYWKQKNTNKALFYIKKALNDLPNNAQKVKLFNLLSDIAQKNNWIEIAVSSKDSIIKINEIINETKNKELLENTSLRFELLESKNNLEINKVNAENKQKIYLLSISILVLLFVILSVIFYKRQKLSKQTKIINENILKIKELELEAEKNQNVILRNEIESKNKMLLEKIVFQSTRNELIENIVETIAQSSVIEPKNELLGTIRNLKTHLKEEAKWEDFMMNFEAVNNTFIKNLNSKHPELNANDIRFLSFIYLNLSTKEIASLINITPESCRKRKERLIKKLNLPVDVSLYNYISKLS